MDFYIFYVCIFSKDDYKWFLKYIFHFLKVQIETMIRKKLNWISISKIENESLLEIIFQTYWMAWL